MIRFLFLEGKSRSEINERLDAVYGDSSPSMATVKNWFNEFQRGRTSVFDEPRPGASKTATTKDNVTKIHDLVLADRRLKVREIADTVGISKDRVGSVSRFDTRRLRNQRQKQYVRENGCARNVVCLLEAVIL